EIGDAAHAAGLEQEAVGIAEMFLEEMVVDLLDEGVKAEIFAIVFSSDGKIDECMAGPRRRHIKLLKQPEGQRFADLRRVERSVAQVERFDTGEAFALHEMVEIEA